ncbi:hypothetical protein ACN28C_26420 [Plantactinospora sp. WMMC1484]|uniref:hypothetical protein n=1 Tax=Plantactinospora sp. WMMC1484 TaxID=3404122 RepID=UPI003BF569A3
MNRKALRATVVAAVLVVTSAALPATANEKVGVEEMLPVLGAPQVPGDRIPGGIDLDAIGGVRPETVRRLGSDDVAEYWVGRLGSSSTCLILHIAGGSEVTAAACGSITDFYNKGLALQAGESRNNPTRSAHAYLLPADVDATALSPMLTKVSSASDSTGPNLLSRQPQDAAPLQPTDLKRDKGNIFTFRPLSNVTGR